MLNFSVSPVRHQDGYVDVLPSGKMNIYVDVGDSSISDTISYIEQCSLSLNKLQKPTDLYVPIKNAWNWFTSHNVDDTIIFIFYVNVKNLDLDRANEKLKKLRDYVEKLKSLNLSYAQTLTALKEAFKRKNGII